LQKRPPATDETGQHYKTQKVTTMTTTIYYYTLSEVKSKKQWVQYAFKPFTSIEAAREEFRNGCYTCLDDVLPTKLVWRSHTRIIGTMEINQSSL
jgi:hypothetical protein